MWNGVKNHLEYGPHDILLLSRVKATTTILCFAASHSLFHKYTPHLVNLLPPVSTQNIFQISSNVYQKTDLIMHFALFVKKEGHFSKQNKNYTICYWWWTGRPGVLQSEGLQRIEHNWATELDWFVNEEVHRSTHCSG